MGDPDHRTNYGSNQSGQGPLSTIPCSCHTLTRACDQTHKAQASIVAFTNLCIIRFIPVLSAQLITAPTGRPREIRNLAPADPPRPVKTNKILDNSWKGQYSND